MAGTGLRLSRRAALLCVAAALRREAAAAPQATPDWLTGVNLAGAEFNPGRSRLNVDYVYPTAGEMEMFAAKGFRVFRIPVLSSRLLVADDRITPDWVSLFKLVAAAQALNVHVVIDLHQFGMVPEGLIGREPAATASFAAVWGVIATRLKNRPNVIFGLMNEPNRQSPAEWRAGAEAGLCAIRNAGARQLVLVPGAAWDGAHSWVSSGNAQAMTGLIDPGGNYAFEVHQYLDSDSSGTHPEVVPGVGASSLVAFTRWARANRVRGFLGEFGFAATPDGMREGEALLSFMHANKDVWRGWTYWAAGAWWGNYMFSVEPGQDGSDKPQTAVLERWK